MALPVVVGTTSAKVVTPDGGRPSVPPSLLSPVFPRGGERVERWGFWGRGGGAFLPHPSPPHTLSSRAAYKGPVATPRLKYRSAAGLAGRLSPGTVAVQDRRATAPLVFTALIVFVFLFFCFSLSYENSSWVSRLFHVASAESFEYLSRSLRVS